MDEQQKLANAYHSNKLSHAYLFEGDDAQSMKHVAMEFAKLILCNGNRNESWNLQPTRLHVCIF